MNDVVNLNKARKARDKARKLDQAQQNRVRFGRTKAEKDLAKAKTAQAERRLDEAKREE